MTRNTSPEASQIDLDRRLGSVASVETKLFSSRERMSPSLGPRNWNGTTNALKLTSSQVTG